MADQPAIAAPAAAPQIEAAAAAFGEGIMPEMGPFSDAVASDPQQVDAMARVFGLAGAGSQSADGGAGGGQGTPPSPSPAAGEGGGVQTPSPGTPPPASPVPPTGAPPPASPSPQPLQPPAQPGPLPPVVTQGAPAAPAQPSPPPPGPAAPAAPAADPRELELASLRAQVAQLVAQAGGQQPPAQQAPQQGQPQPGQPPEYGLQVPLQHLALIQGEDQAQAQHALSNVINQVASHIHARVMADVQQYVPAVVANGLGTVQSERTMDAAVQDYYGTFTSHKTPAVQAIVANELSKMQGEFPGVPWSDNYRNTLGARVNQQLSSLGVQVGEQGAPPPPAPPPPAPPPPAPAMLLPVGTRPAGGPTTQAVDPSAFMMETFGYGAGGGGYGL